jgi:small subunit ribosomal protein S4
MKIGPKYKIARRLGPAVFEKTQTQKFALSEARHAAGKKKDKRSKALSDFGLQLIEKQRVRFSYGITERQLGNYVQKAIETKGNPAENLFASLESRLDNVVYRLGIAHTRRLARQMVSHGHFIVNGKRTTVPSYAVKSGDVVTAREGSRKSVLFTELPTKLKNYSSPKWLKFDIDNVKAEVVGVPVLESGSAINLNAVFEFYSR